MSSWLYLCRSNDTSEPQVPVKRRRLNGDGVECNKVATSNHKTSAAAISQNVDNTVRVTRSLVNNKTLESKRLLSRSVEKDAVTSPKVLPSTTASRGGSLHLRQQSRSKTVALPRSLDASCASTTFSGRGNTSFNNQSTLIGRPRLTLPETPAVMKYVLRVAIYIVWFIKIIYVQYFVVVVVVVY